MTMSSFILLLCITYVSSAVLPSSDLTRDVKALIQRMDAVERENAELKKQLVSQRQTRVADPEVAFTARLTHNAHLTSSQTVIFDQVTTNIGNAYDANLGIFQAPASGTYFFFFTAFSSPNKSAHLQLIKDGIEISRAYTAQPGYDTGSNAVVVQLAAGDRVWVKHHDGASDESLYSDYYITFTGYMIM